MCVSVGVSLVPIDMHMYAHTYMLNMINMIIMDASMRQPFSISIHVYFRVMHMHTHVCMCGHVGSCEEHQDTPTPTPRRAGGVKLILDAIPQ